MSVVISMYNRVQHQGDLSLFADPDGTLSKMSEKDHQDVLMFVEELNEYWWSHSADVVRLESHLINTMDSAHGSADPDIDPRQN